MGTEPFRSCVACRTSRPKRELIRLYPAGDGRLNVDLGGGSGRGAYVCPRRPCLEQAVKRGEFARCLKTAVAPLTVETLEGLIREGVARKVTALLGLARRAGKIVSGAEAVDSAVKRHSVRLILAATDASANSIAKVRHVAAQVGVVWMQAMGKTELGAAVGGAPRACIAVMDPHFAGALMSVLNNIPAAAKTREAAWSDRQVEETAGPRKARG